LGARL